MDNEWHTTACHVGTYGNSDYIAQSPSNVWCPDTLGTQQGINTIDDEGGISIINHPHTDFGVWDCDSVDGISGETGIEIWNGEWDSRDEQAKDTWLDKIQDGDKVLALGGSDSHGQVSGLSTNYNYAGMSSITHANLEEGLASGANMISNDGGYLRISAKTNTQSTWTEMGGEFDAYTNEIITIRVKHNLVHGCNLQVRRGEIGYSGEDYASFYVSGQDEFDVPYPIIDSGEYYFRAECISSGGDYRLYTNPIWVNVYYMPDDEICNDGLDNDNDGYADCADGDCTLGTSCGSNKWCCGSGCSSNGGTCACPSSSGITCADGNCNTYGEACCDGELERDMECSGTSLDCDRGCGAYDRRLVDQRTESRSSSGRSR